MCRRVSLAEARCRISFRANPSLIRAPAPAWRVWRDLEVRTPPICRKSGLSPVLMKKIANPSFHRPMNNGTLCMPKCYEWN
ncbi:hypothetical protein BF49_4335 [Bradyrhizobium sp.]|nr:hypothetical protein BF49_4335 [Bradyrhizobium sp.]